MSDSNDSEAAVQLLSTYYVSPQGDESRDPLLEFGFSGRGAWNGSDGGIPGTRLDGQAS